MHPGSSVGPNRTEMVSEVFQNLSCGSRGSRHLPGLSNASLGLERLKWYGDGLGSLPIFFPWFPYPFSRTPEVQMVRGLFLGRPSFPWFPKQAPYPSCQRQVERVVRGWENECSSKALALVRNDCAPTLTKRVRGVGLRKPKIKAPWPLLWPQKLIGVA